MKKIKILLFFILLISFIACRNNKPKTESNIHPNKNKTLKTFTFENLKNVLHNGKKRILILNFWATWCPSCRKEIPDFIQFYDEFKDKVTLIGLALDESEADVENFIKLAKINYPIYICDKRLAEHFMVQAIPVTFVFKDGKYVYSHVGEYPYYQLKSDISQLLK